MNHHSIHDYQINAKVSTNNLIIELELDLGSNVVSKELMKFVEMTERYCIVFQYVKMFT
jgi:hypothetical protein